MASQTEYLQLQLLGTSLQDKETYFEQWRQTINGEIDDSNMKIIDRACKQMADDIADLKYVPIAINTFTANPASAEKGSAVHNITFAYALNKVPTSLKFNDEELTPAKSGEKAISMTNITANTTWTLEAKDNGSANNSPKTVTKNVTLTFMNKAYWGVGAIPETLNSAFILGLANSVLTTAKGRTMTVNAGSGQYVWYALPSSLGNVSFKVGGFDGGFEPAQKIQFKNASGFTEEYNVYRSTNASLGQTTIVAS